MVLDGENLAELLAKSREILSVCIYRSPVYSLRLKLCPLFNAIFYIINSYVKRIMYSKQFLRITNLGSSI